MVAMEEKIQLIKMINNNGSMSMVTYRRMQKGFQLFIISFQRQQINFLSAKLHILIKSFSNTLIGEI
jgi:hypothetical protein